MTQTPRVLVCVLGNLRGSPVAWNSLLEHVVAPNNADLALCYHNTGDGGEEENTVLYKAAKYRWRVPEFSDWGVALDGVAKGETAWRKVLPMPGILWGGVFRDGARLKGSGAIIYFFRHCLKGRLLAHKLHEAYDAFVITRADHFYVRHPKIELLDLRRLWIPEGEDYGGLCDRHMIVGKENVVAVLSMLDCLFADPDKFVATFHLGGAHRRLNTEIFLSMFLRENKLHASVRRFERTFFLVKTATDQTSWAGNALFVDALGLYCKYPNELRLTNVRCKTDIR
uniref:Uncharacterized protein n=1 Tax=Marseillevirus LCMAC103 TaxID=2506604 RepID=A0A481YUV2_9VIRU|nr:MAG: hypothetical protein LCMAC103_03100 [Marseillevirus LCMAC103]